MRVKTALIAAVAALVGAAIAVGAFLVASETGDDSGDDEVDPIVVQLELAADTAEESGDLTRAVEGIANGAKGGGTLGSVRNATTRLLGRSAALASDAVASRQLRRANESNLAATGLLESIGSEVALARTAIDEEELASEEASDRLAGLSTSVGGLEDQITRAKRRAGSAVTELQGALAALRAQLMDAEDDSTEAQLIGVERNLRSLGRDLRQAFDSLTEAADSLSGELSDRSVELEPDVVLDCPELTANGAGLWEVSVRNISCAEAAALLGPYGPPTGFACTELDSGWEFTQYRCTSGDRAIRYTLGA